MARLLAVCTVLFAAAPALSEDEPAVPAVLTLTSYRGSQGSYISANCAYADGVMNCNGEEITAHRDSEGTCSIRITAVKDKLERIGPGTWREMIPSRECPNFLYVTELRYDAKRRAWSYSFRVVNPDSTAPAYCTPPPDRHYEQGARGLASGSIDCKRVTFGY